MSKMGRTVQAVDRTLAIMEQMAQIGRPATLTEISKGVGLNISTTHRLLYTLISQGYAEQDFITGRYRLGCKAIQVGQSALYSMEIRRAAIPWLERMTMSLKRSLYLAVRNGDTLFVVFRSVSEGDNKILPQVGEEISVFDTLPGQLFVRIQKANPSEPAWNIYVHQNKSKESIGQLAVPVFDHSLRAVGAITIVSKHDEDLCQYLPELQETAWEISRQLGVDGIPGMQRIVVNLGNRD